MTTIQCYNKGCGKKFDPSENNNESCIYHPGPPYFHDAYKIWKCCGKKSTDFSTWLSYRGCTKGLHNGEKPPDVVKQAQVTEVRNEKPEEVIVWNGLNKPAERKIAHEFESLTIDITPSALEAIQKHTQQSPSTNGNNLIGATCRNNSCKEVYKGTDADQSSCYYHSGTAIFHEGMKYWSCCEKKTTDFSTFLDQLGCTTGTHNWTPSEIVDKFREDWFSRIGFIHINVYCKGALPDKCSFETNGQVLRGTIVHGFGEKKTELTYELWGEVVPSESKAVVGERKIEFVLKQAKPEGWPKLKYDPTTVENTSEIKSCHL